MTNTTARIIFIMRNLRRGIVRRCEGKLRGQEEDLGRVPQVRVPSLYANLGSGISAPTVSFVVKSVVGSLRDIGVGFDFDEHVGIDQAGDANHRRRGPDITKELTMSAPDLFPVHNIDHEDARAHDIFQAPSSPFQGGLDVFQDLHRLRIGISGADDFPIRARGCRSSYMYVRSDSNGARVTHYRLPRGATRDIFALYTQQSSSSADHCSRHAWPESNFAVSSVGRRVPIARVQLSLFMRVLNKGNRFFEWLTKVTCV